MLKKMENSVRARMHPCLTPFEMGKLPDRDPFVLHLTLLTLMLLAEVGKKLWGTAKARKNFRQSITASSINDLGQVYESWI